MDVYEQELCGTKSDKATFVSKCPSVQNYTLIQYRVVGKIFIYIYS